MLIGTTPTLTESIEVPRISDTFTPGIFPVTGDVLSIDAINMTAVYLAKTAIKEDLEEEHE